MDDQVRPQGASLAIAKQAADIRRALEATPSPNTEERQRLDEKAFALLDAPLQTLLEAHHLTLIVSALLVARNIFSIDDLARKLHQNGSDTNDLFTGTLALRQDCGSDLFSQTETRAKLLAVPLNFKDNNARKAWLDTLCNDHPTMASLFQKRYAELNVVLTGASEVDRNSVISVWIAAEQSVNPSYDVRRLIRASALPLSLIDTLESIPLNSIADLTEHIYERVVRTLSADADKSKLLRLFRERSTSERQRRTAESAQLKQALDDMKELKSDVERSSVTPEQLRARLNDIKQSIAANSTIGLSDNPHAQNWTISEADAADGHKAVQLLANYEAEVRSVFTQLERGTVEDDAQLISSVSAGEALRGIPFGMAPHFIGYPALRPLLRAPEYCPFLHASLPLEWHCEQFSSSSACTRYNETLSRSGRSFAASLKGSGWGFSVEASGSSTTTETISRERTESTSASKSIYLFAPVRAFSIGHDQMKLTEEARNDARWIGNLIDARIYLERYYSHFSSAVQHVGGIFIQTITVSTASNSSVSSLQTKASEAFSASFGGGGGLGFSLAPAMNTSTFMDDSNSSGGTVQKTCTITSESKCFGPAISNPELFVKAVFSDTGSWYIIDRGGFNSLVPIWKILERDGDATVRSKAPLLRRAWLAMARSWKSLGDASINTHIRNVEMEECSFLNGLPAGETITDDEAKQLVVNQEIDAAVSQIDGAIATRVGSSFNIDQMTSVGLAQVVLDVNRIISKYGARHNLIPAVVARGSIQVLLNAIADCPDNEKTRFARQLVQVLISPENRTRILQQAETSDFFSRPRILQLFQDAPRKTAAATTANSFEPKLLDQVLKLEDEVNALINEAESSRLAVDEKSHRLGVFLSLNLRCEVGERDRALRDFLREMLAAKFELLRGGFYRTLNDEQISLVCQYISKAVQSFKKIEATALSGDEFYRYVKDQLQAEFETTDAVETQATQVTPAVITDYPPSTCKNYAALLLDRPHSSMMPVEELLIDVLRHRLSLDPIKEKLGSSDEETDDSSSLDCRRMLERALAESELDSLSDIDLEAPYDTKLLQTYQVLLSLLSNADLSAKEYLLRLLLERRLAVPLLYAQAGSNELMTTTLALSFISTSVSSKQLISLGNDTSLLRIAVLSHRSPSQSNTASLIKNVFSCGSMHTLSELTQANEGSFPSVIVEVGFGFIPEDKEPNKVVMLVHVIGNYRLILPWLQRNNLVHMYMVEDEPKEQVDRAPKLGFVNNSDLSPFKAFSLLLYCPSTSSYTVAKTKKLPSRASYIEFSGMLGTSESKISKDFHSTILTCSKLFNTPLLDLGTAVFKEGELILREEDRNIYVTVRRMQNQVEGTLQNVNMGTLRSQQFLLQHSFKRESEAEFKAAEDAVHLGHSAAVQTAASQKRAEEQRNRTDLAESRSMLPIIQLCLQLAAVQSPVERYIFFRSLENALAIHSRPFLTTLKEDYARLESKRLQDPDNPLFVRQARQARQLFADTTCHIEHIWRELSHLFIANLGSSHPRCSDFPQMAAQHLLDGFPLELMDGDAGKMNDIWVKLVLEQLRTILRTRDGKEARVFVLSILGVQSSGKSTLLNILFGCRFRVSTGMCTRGVNMMLIKVENRAEYDYIVLLDTEGVRSESLADTTTRDNRLAAFAIWPADATIIMIAGEDSEALKKILPVVGDAYQSSPLAERYGHQLVSKLFFAQRGLTASANDGIGAQEGLKSNLQSSLHDSLRSISIDQQKQRQHSLLQQQGGKDVDEARDAMGYDYSSALAALKHLVAAFADELTDDILLGALIVTKQGRANADVHKALQVLHLSTEEETLEHSYNYADLKKQAARYYSFKSTLPANDSEEGSKATIFDMIKDFNVGTDHVILGMNIESDCPPKDVPNPNYGYQLLQFRETIHERVVGAAGWRARTIGEWTDYLREVWPAIMSANLALSRESIEQRRVHEAIDAVAAQQRSLVANAYASAFDQFDKDLTANKEKWREVVAKRVEESARAHHRHATEKEKEDAFVAEQQFTVNLKIQYIISEGQAAINKLVVDYPMYQEFAVMTRERWQQFLATQKQRSDQRIADRISNRVFYLNIVDQYKSQVVTKVDELLRTQSPAVTQAWSDAEREAKFNLIFTPIVKDAEKKFPSLSADVERRIRDIFYSISRDQMPVVSEAYPAYSKKPKVGAIFRRFWNAVSGKDAQLKRQKDQDKRTLKDTFTKVEELLGPTTPYSDPLVHKAIDIIQDQLLGDKRVEFHREVRQQVYLLLVDRLTKSQQAWEVENSVPQRLQKDQLLLFETFKGRCDNLTTAQLFQGAIEVLVRRNSPTLLSVFKAEVKGRVIQELISETNGVRKHKWAGRPDGEALQALVDLDLLDTITKGNDTKLMADLRSPGTHYDCLVKRKLTEVTQNMLDKSDIWDNLRNKITTAVNLAATIAFNVPSALGVAPRRVSAFLDRLREEGLPADFIDRLPSEVDYNTKLDEAPDVFTTIASNIIRAIPPAGLVGMPITKDSSRVRDIVAMVWMEMTTYRAGSALQARCDSGCKMCGLACTKERGHSGNHTTHHQPTGLNGWRHVATKVLWKYSCVENQRNRTGFIYGENQYSYTDWTTVFTGWDAPAGTTVRLKVREYIFYHKQAVLVREFPNTIAHPPPPEFNHREEDLRRDLKIAAGLQ